MYKTIWAADSAPFDQLLSDAEKDGFTVVSFAPNWFNPVLDDYGDRIEVIFTALMHKPDPAPPRTGMTVEENIGARINAQAAASDKSAFQNVAETLGGLWENAVEKIMQPDAERDELREEARQHGVGQ